ncbi:MAG: hypothetical protein ACTSRG_21945 [Candidatus Helarchaeota archaeon]
MKFLDSKGGLDLVKEYFAEAIPNYLLKYEGTGGAKKFIAKQWFKRNPSGYLHMIIDKLREDCEFLSQKHEIIEDRGEQLVSKIDCKYLRKLIRKGKTYGCEFDLRDYYCKNTCIPLLSKLLNDAYIKINVELIKNGCIQTITADKSILD